MQNLCFDMDVCYAATPRKPLKPGVRFQKI